MQKLFRVFFTLFALTFWLTPIHAADDDAADVTVPDTANAVAADDTIPIGRRASRDIDPYSHYYRTSITPMGGLAGYVGNWNAQVYNQYSLGLGIDFPISTFVSTEVEGGFAQYSTNYALLKPIWLPFNAQAPHVFNQYNLGVNGKVYLMRHHVFRPYVGIGFMGLYYQNMQRPQALLPFRYYNQLVGAGQAILGADVSVSEDVGLGVRGAWVLPLVNRPQVGLTPFGTSAPGFEDASIINSSFFKLMGTVRVNL